MPPAYSPSRNNSRSDNESTVTSGWDSAAGRGAGSPSARGAVDPGSTTFKVYTVSIGVFLVDARSGDSD